MIKVRNEYRINKKGAECFRTESLNDAVSKLKELSEKHPGLYTMQSRHVRLDRYGVAEHDYKGRPAWSIWN